MVMGRGSFRKEVSVGGSKPAKAKGPQSPVPPILQQPSTAPVGTVAMKRGGRAAPRTGRRGRG